MKVDATLLIEQQKSSISPYLTLDWRSAICGKSTTCEAYKIIDSLAHFQDSYPDAAWYVQPGWGVRNRSDNRTITVVSVVSETELTITDNYISNWPALDYYSVYSPWYRFDNLGSTNRIISITHSQEPLGSSGVFTLQNNASHYDGYDLNGKQIRIGKGFVCIVDDVEVPLVAYDPILWCNGQSFYSEPGGDIFVVQGMGAWNKLASVVASNPNFYGYYYNQPDTDATLDNKTVRQILAHLLSLCGLYLDNDYGTLDTMIDVSKPVFTVLNGSETLASAVYRLLLPFQSVLVPINDGMQLRWCQDGDGVDYIYQMVSP